jgi:excisionase family DNA binding protein
MSQPVSFLVPIRVPGDFPASDEDGRRQLPERHVAGGRPLVLTMEQAADLLSIGRSTMYELVRTGQIESITIGRLRRIPSEALENFVARLRGFA